MAYTPTTWATGDTITATALNKMEQGIANGGSGYDAVIRLTHAENSGADTLENLTPSIVSGTYSGLYAKYANGGCPIILVEYINSFSGAKFAAPMGFIDFVDVEIPEIIVIVAGYSPLGTTGTSKYMVYGSLVWSDADALSWA